MNKTRESGPIQLKLNLEKYRTKTDERRKTMRLSDLKGIERLTLNFTKEQMGEPIEEVQPWTDYKCIEVEPEN